MRSELTTARVSRWTFGCVPLDEEPPAEGSYTIRIEGDPMMVAADEIVDLVMNTYRLRASIESERKA